MARMPMFSRPAGMAGRPTLPPAVVEGARTQAQRIADMGRGGDSTMVHMNPGEVRGLAQMAGRATLPRNPQTGLPEAAVLDDQLNPDAAGDAASDQDTMAGGATEDTGPVVLATIVKYDDGSLGVQTGDAPSEMEGEGSGEEAGGGLLDAGPGAGGETFAPDDSGLGALLNRVREIVESGGGSSGSADMSQASRQKDFQSGYNGEGA